MLERKNLVPRLVAGVLVLALVIALGIAVVKNIRQEKGAELVANALLDTSPIPTSPLTFAAPQDWGHIVFVPSAQTGVVGKRYDIFYDATKFTAAQALAAMNGNTLAVVTPPSGIVVVSQINDNDTQTSIERDVTIARNQGYFDTSTYTIIGAQEVTLVHQSGAIRLAQMKAGSAYYAVAISPADKIVGKDAPIYQLIQSFH